MALTLLENVTVVDADLSKLEPRILKHLFPSKEDFTEQIAVADRQVYRDLKNYIRALNPEYSNAELETAMTKLKDLIGEYVKDAVIYKSFVIIYLGNDIKDKAQYYLDLYEGADLKGYVDDNSDDIVDEGEGINKDDSPVFTRA